MVCSRGDREGEIQTAIGRDRVVSNGERDREGERQTERGRALLVCSRTARAGNTDEGGTFVRLVDAK